MHRTRDVDSPGTTDKMPLRVALRWKRSPFRIFVAATEVCVVREALDVRPEVPRERALVILLPLIVRIVDQVLEMLAVWPGIAEPPHAGQYFRSVLRVIAHHVAIARRIIQPVKHGVAVSRDELVIGVAREKN